MTQPVIEQFAKIVKEAREQFINERINDRFKSALSTNKPETEPELTGNTESTPDDSSADDGIETTQDEIDAYNIVKAILREIVDIKRSGSGISPLACGFDIPK